MKKAGTTQPKVGGAKVHCPKHHPHHHHGEAGNSKNKKHALDIDHLKLPRGRRGSGADSVRHLGRLSDNEDETQPETDFEKAERLALNNHFKKQVKKSFLFEVTRTPCEYHFELFMFLMPDWRGATAKVDAAKDQITFYENKRLIANFHQWFFAAARIFVLLIDLVYFLVALFTKKEKDPRPHFQLSHLNLLLTLATLLMPALLNAAEAWANAIFDTLFEYLLLQDYNRNFDSFFATSQSNIGVQKE